VDNDEVELGCKASPLVGMAAAYIYGCRDCRQDIAKRERGLVDGGGDKTHQQGGFGSGSLFVAMTMGQASDPCEGKESVNVLSESSSSFLVRLFVADRGGDGDGTREGGHVEIAGELDAGDQPGEHRGLRGEGTLQELQEDGQRHLTRSRETRGER
jgi:hypothetical protein